MAAGGVERTQALSERVTKLERILTDFLPKRATSSTPTSTHSHPLIHDPTQGQLVHDQKTAEKTETEARAKAKAQRNAKVDHACLFSELQALERDIAMKESTIVGVTDVNRKYLQRLGLLRDVSALMDCSLDTETKLTLLVAANAEIEALAAKLNRIDKLAKEVVEQPVLEQNHEEGLQRLEAEFANTTVSVQAFHADVQALLAAYSETMDAVSRFFLSHVNT